MITRKKARSLRLASAANGTAVPLAVPFLLVLRNLQPTRHKKTWKILLSTTQNAQAMLLQLPRQDTNACGYCLEKRHSLTN